MSNYPPIVADATKPPPAIETTLTWVRMSSGRLPPENDPRTFLLLLATGGYALGRRLTLRRVMRPGGPIFVYASAVGGLIETAFVDHISTGVPIDDVVQWAAIESPR